MAAFSEKKWCVECVGVNSLGIAPVLFFQTEYNLHKTGREFSRDEKAFILRSPDVEKMRCADRVVRKSRFYMPSNVLFLPDRGALIYNDRLLSSGANIAPLPKRRHIPLPDQKNVVSLPEGVYVIPPECDEKNDFSALISETLPYLYSVFQSFPEKPLTVLIPDKEVSRARAHAYRYVKMRYPFVRFARIPSHAAGCRIPHLLYMERTQNAPASFMDGYCLDFVQKALPPAKTTSRASGGKYYLAYGSSRDERSKDAALAPLLHKAGYKIVYADAVSASRLAEIFAGADAVVGPDSPAFAHMIFAKKECAIAIFYTPNGYRDFYVWLAKSVGLRPLHVSTEFDDNGRFHRRVTPPLLKKTLKTIDAHALLKVEFA